MTAVPGQSEHAGAARRWLAPFPPRRWHLALAGGCLAALYLGTVTNKWWPSPDSALYLGLGRSLAAGQGYVFNGRVSNAVPPGFPLILAGLRRVFGAGYWAPHLFAAACGLGALGIAYAVLRRMSSPRMALAVVLCAGFSYTYYLKSHTILTGAPFLLLFWAVLRAGGRAVRGSIWWLCVAVVLIVAALLVRAPGVLLLGPLAVGLAVDTSEGASGRRRLLVAGTLLLAMLATMGGLYLLARAASEGVNVYLDATREQLAYPLWRVVLSLPEGLLAIPAAVAEMLTSQKGLWHVFGVPAAAWMVIGGVVLWRRGQRLPAVTVALSVLGLSLSAVGAWAIRPRLLLPLHVLMAYLMFEGVCWTVRGVCRWRRRRPSASLYLKAATVLAVFVLGVNAPRLLRNAVYYCYLSYTPRYYEVIRDGQHARLLGVADHLRQLQPVDEPIAAPGGDHSVLHYVTGLRTLAMPDDPSETASDAQRVLEFVRSQPGFSLVAVNTKDGEKEYRRALQRGLKGWPQLDRIYEKPGWQVYRRSER